jgi:hypothetical protein
LQIEESSLSTTVGIVLAWLTAVAKVHKGRGPKYELVSVGQFSGFPFPLSDFVIGQDFATNFSAILCAPFASLR